MKKMMFSAALMVLICSGSVIAEGKTAVIDMEMVVKAHPSAKISYEILQGLIHDFEAEQKALIEERKVLESEFQAAAKEIENRALSDAARLEKRKIASEKMRAVKVHENKRQKQFAARQKELEEREIRMRDKIVEKVNVIIRDYCKSRGINLVLDSSAVSATGLKSVVVHDAKLDITDAILKIIADSKD